MIDNEIYTLVNSQSGELAFKLYTFESIHHLDHIQRLNYYALIWIKEGTGKITLGSNSFDYQKK